jgi:RimJ/RimL family protein N-acetyltransferase
MPGVRPQDPIHPTMADLIEVETERLCLRQWRESDLASFAELNADRKVMEFFPEPLESGASDELAKRIRSLLAARGWGVWAVEVKGGTPFIGFVGLHVPVAALPFSPCVEIAWRLCASHWGRGYASEAARASLKVAFERLALPEVVAFTAIGNQRSRRVMERLGMQFSGYFEHPGVPQGNPLKLHVLYRQKASRFRSAKRTHAIEENDKET